MSLPTAVIVMAKAPVAGLAKTRLIPALGADGAARLAQRFLVETVRQAMASGVGEVELCCAPDRHHPAFAEIASRAGLTLTDQGGGDLGARMARAIDRRLGAGLGVGLGAGNRAILIGTDVPALDADVLRRAQQALADHDAVFAPTLDGGYALIGLRRPAAPLFDAMPWSTDQVMAVTRGRMLALGLRHVELPMLADVDEPADLVHVPAQWF